MMGPLEMTNTLQID